MAQQLIQHPRTLCTVPLFLAPAFSSSIPTLCTRSFSSSPTSFNRVPRGNRDKNKKRGVSAIWRTGPRYPSAVGSPESLPKPVADPTEARAAFEVNPNHGLWGFFNGNKESLVPAGEEYSHGRPWSQHELSKKGFNDLHQLYWLCIKETNIVNTRNNERKRLRVGYGEVEAEERIKNLRTTMSRIRKVLVRRHYSTFDAQLLLENKFLFELFPDLLQQHMSPEDFGNQETAELDAMSTEQNLAEEGEPVIGSPSQRQSNLEDRPRQ